MLAWVRRITHGLPFGASFSFHALSIDSCRSLEFGGSRQEVTYILHDECIIDSEDIDSGYSFGLESIEAFDVCRKVRVTRGGECPRNTDLKIPDDIRCAFINTVGYSPLTSMFFPVRVRGLV